MLSSAGVKYEGAASLAGETEGFGRPPDGLLFQEHTLEDGAGAGQRTPGVEGLTSHGMGMGSGACGA